jgi:3-oxoacyl-[acyl-carrier protein] reductase
MDLHGKEAVVRGSSRGIGKPIALARVRCGANIVVPARTAEPGQSKSTGTINETAQELRALGARLLTVRADLTIRNDVRRLYETALEHFGRVDLLINNAAYIGKGIARFSIPLQ